MNLLNTYESLSASSGREDVGAALRSIVEAPPFALASADRDRLVELLLQDINAIITSSNGKGRLTQKEAGPALLALKTLGRAAAASIVISSQSNLRVLLSAAESFRAVDSDAADDALRCIANALLLVEKGRASWVEIQGATHCVDLLSRTTSTSCIFLCCRILFLCTASSTSELHKILMDRPAAPIFDRPVERGGQQGIIDVIAKQLDFLLSSILQGSAMSKEAMTDLLKFTFNILCYWPRIATDAEDLQSDSGNEERHEGGLSEDTPVLGERWTRRLDGLLPPLRRVFLGLPSMSPSPLAAPLTHVLHSLLPIPLDKRLCPVWFPEAASPAASGSSTPHSMSTPPGAHEAHEQASLSPGPNEGISSKGKEKDGESRGALDRALSMLTPRLSLSSRSSSPNHPQNLKDAERHQSFPKVLRRCLELLDASLIHYLPGNVDPDDASVRLICTHEDVQLDHVLAPLVLLMTKFCKFSMDCRKVFKRHILPPDLDRTSPIEGRADTLGRCVRLMACVNHQQLKSAVGELLFVACDSDAQTLSSQIGYGNAAGFLFNKGILSAPPPASPGGASDDIDPSVNPITGMIQQERPAGPDMTEEEKEREAEKLFVLFERLEKSGGMENPIKKALREGKLEKYSERIKPDEADSD
ncbi:hypothetical protein M0805_007893 [Coniferiporia weirii]|nr:hypothetical protein M0805_007893 [Coniferiporia weirii]